MTYADNYKPGLFRIPLSLKDIRKGTDWKMENPVLMDKRINGIIL